MEKPARKQARIAATSSEEVSSIEWEYINMTEQEEDLIDRMYRLVGDRYSIGFCSKSSLTKLLILK